MKFGRVYGVVTQNADHGRWLTVVLDTGRDVQTVRDEAVNPLLASEDPAWLADQLVQETIGNELAEEGWEVVGPGATDDEQERVSGALAVSPTWVVRLL